jgi:hypothetical protein
MPPEKAGLLSTWTDFNEGWYNKNIILVQKGEIVSHGIV